MSWYLHVMCVHIILFDEFFGLHFVVPNTWPIMAVIESVRAHPSQGLVAIIEH